MNARPLLMAGIATCLLVGLAACDAGTPPGTGTGMGTGMGHRFSHRSPGTALCSPPESLPGTVVDVVVGDMGTMPMMGRLRMMMHAVPWQVPAGTVSFVVDNVGRRTHEMVVLPLAPGHRAGERVPGPDHRISEAGSLGEASATCAAGEGDGIRRGGFGWVTLPLAPGRYELVCNLPRHYAAGMRQEIVVR